ncbi:substrate-binding domain-containing protein [Coraliomargarita parva]|uniref:substrate-binding domain-containing protein n=1 Tax=Coraliomargarita parva TaxID=3014050 RepID=UPI0022B2F6A9|nr:substrate-binding domain-containing protein [Coraliomargarita parva]
MADSIPSKRLKVIEALSRELEKPKYADGLALPSEGALQQRLGVSRGTIRQALAELEQHDLIYRIKGKGTFVRPKEEARPKPVVFLIREPWKVSHFHNAELLRGMQMAATAAGASVLVNSQTPGEWTVEFCNSIAGVVVLPRLLVDSDLLVLRQRRVPYCMAMESDLEGATIVDHIEEAAYELANGLIELGHRRIALLSGHFEHSDRFKKRGIERAAKEAGIDFRTWPDYCTNYEAALAYEIAQDIMGQRNRPTAIIGFDNVLAVQAIRAAKDAGLQLPQDLSVVGFGGRDFSDLMDPALSTVNLRGELAGKLAVESLLSSTWTGDRRIEAGYDLVWRGSSGDCAAE